MASESRLRPILGHLAWLADRIEDPVNDGRLKDAALLTYNAAAMLQWYFVAPSGYTDTITTGWLRAEVADAINRLVISAEKTTAQADHTDSDNDKRLRGRLVTEIKKVLWSVQRALGIADPMSARMPELEKPPNLKQLLDDFLAAHAEKYRGAIAKGQRIGAKGSSAPNAAINEAIAELIYIHDDARETDMSPALRQLLAQMATGFFKTAVEMLPEDVPHSLRKRLARCAEALTGNPSFSKP